MTKTAADLRKEVLKSVARYYEVAHADRTFVRGKTRVQYAGRVYDEKEMVGMVDAVLDFWLTAGPRTQEFEHVLAEFIGTREVIPVNSGSSANLVAVTTLCSKQLRGRRLEAGDEVIVPATSFPTTVAPIVQNRLLPVLWIVPSVITTLIRMRLRPQFRRARALSCLRIHWAIQQICRELCR